MMNPLLSACLSAHRRQRGFSLIELMIAITIGLLIILALTALYLNITRNNSELAKANSQIENGRFALQMLESDLVHAGYWGELNPAAATAIPADPCLAGASWDAAFKANMLGIPVMGYDSATVPATCAMVSGALAAGDVLMVRHAHTCPVGSTECDGGADTGPHIQVSTCTKTPEAAYVIDSTTFPLREKGCSATIAARRKVVTNIYYLATSNGQPTLMRVSMANGAYQTLQPLVEGIEAFKVEYGIDNLGKNGLAVSASNPGDGSADSYLSVPPTTLDQLGNIVAVKVHVLARNLEKSPGYSDSKTYQLGGTPFAPADAGYKRHVFSTTIRLVNPSGRREAP
jgi:type IV pilus assembly protein PilW